MRDDESKPREPWRITEPELDEPSPHAWVAGRVWRQRRQWSRFIFEDERAGGDIFGRGEDSARAIPVTPELFARAPVMPVPPEEPVPPEGSLEEQQARLRETHEVGAEWPPDRWPVCCRRLAVLTLVNPTAAELTAWEWRRRPLTLETLDDARYEGMLRRALEDVRADRLPYMSFNVFQCHACGRVHVRLAKYPKMAPSK
ncbi:hypothetical protein HPC49_33470 [Pyxidicoccus fallax]|uniref:Uncharacterized protein n=1 Tax=Pyxidicoccus fallax TaxID=394095 RepID=A0A848LMC5_9BACT|nr:hypothetical protein [Pyxidicoccus fallax]NMO18975.1 hypothetical protein [Pyxidicoccus fallax]NPC83119.1 hypothetical protein [Pyxidicoccus fallax]